MTTRQFTIACFVLVLATSPSACTKTQNDSSEPATATASEKEDPAINLCEAYAGCNECIAGQQTRGNSEGEAETQCAVAVTGCWTTWDKPVVCNEDTYDHQAVASADKGPINLCEAYSTCDACITGQQTRGNSEGEAETQCAFAVSGCWMTWDKPVVCGESTYDEQPHSAG
jgi:hypothetical protein